MALKQSSENLESFLELRKSNLDLWAAQPIIDVFFSSPELTVLAAPGVDTFFSRVKEDKTWVKNILLIDHGEILYAQSDNQNELKNWLATEDIKKLFENPEPSCFVLDVPSSHQITKTTLFVKRPFIKNNLPMQGKFLVDLIDLEALQKSLLGKVKIGTNGFVFLLAKKPNETVWLPEHIKVDSVFQNFKQKDLQWNKWPDIPASTKFYSLDISRLGSYPLAIAGVVPINDISNTVYFLVRTLILAGIFVLVLGIGLTMVLSKAISKPLVDLLHTIEQINFDNLQVIHGLPNFSYYTEVRILHQAFAQMIDKLIVSTKELRLTNEELKNMEQSLRIQRNYLHTTLSCIGDGVITTDKIGNITFINSVAEQIINCDGAQIVNTPLDEVFHIISEKTKIAIENPVAKIIKSGEIVELADHTLLVNSDKREIPIENNGAPIKDDEGNLYGVVMVIRDISRRKNSERLIRENDERFRILFENNPISIWLEDLSAIKNFFNDLKNEGIEDIEDYLKKHPEAIVNCAELIRIVDVNQATLVLYEANTKENLVTGIQNSRTPDWHAFFKNEIIGFWTGETSIQKDAKVKTLSGRERNVAIHCNVVPGFEESLAQVLISMTDITERLKLEEQLLQAQKMETIGTLAGGVAHDYNNMLSVILGYSEMALKNVQPEELLHDNLTEIRKAALRSAEITRQLLAFARKQTISPQILDLNKTVESMLKMLKRLIGENIGLAWCPSPDSLLVKMDPSQIDQILVNLCVNARDAIPDVGKITIETAVAIIDETYCADHAGFVPGNFVILAVSDSGTGMDRETLTKIFDPFFTTKGVGRGTGLGLSTVYGIVKQNCGYINVYSEPGNGTTFRIYFSRHIGTLTADSMIDNKTIPQGKGESVLVVEDEAATLKMIQKMLSQLGYRVLTAMTPAEAIALAKENVNDISLLITDVIMPEMNGRELAKHMGTLYPQIKQLYMSGYTANVISHHGILDENVFFLQKPFSKNELAIKVRAALDSSNLDYS
jgi:two-component system, cell cycle sensor histidine kinase and response regulator CckA